MNHVSPNFVMIGAQKSGSTYLLQCLSAHPEIYLPPAEIAFFETEAYSREGMEAFFAKFTPPPTARVIGYKRANLLGQSWVAQRLHDCLGPVGLIAVLREPISRCLSAYFHYMSTGLIPVVPVEQGLRSLLSGEWSKYPRAEEILSFGRYAEHLRQYTRVFGRERLFVRLLDDFRDRQPAVMQQAFSFLGVSESVTLPTALGRPMAAPYSMARIRWRRRFEDRAKTWSADGKYFEYRPGIAWRAYVGGVRWLDQQVLKRLFPAPQPKLSAELKQDLLRYYADDRADLADYLGRSLSAWDNPR